MLWLFVGLCLGFLAFIFLNKRKSGEIAKADYSSLIGNASKQGKKILAIVNPHGGKRRAVRVWNSIVPALTTAGFAVETVRTERKHHATEIARNACYRDVKPDICVCVGGDGFLFEVLNGLCENPNGTLPEEIATKIPVSLVPEGTGNGCASSLGIRSAADAVRTLTQGTLGLMDLMVVTQKNFRKVSGLSFAWGAVADYDYYAEIKLRSLGPPRNWLAPVLVIGQLNSRQGRILMKLHKEKDSQWISRGGRKNQTTVSVDHKGSEWESISGRFSLVQLVSMPWVASDALAVPGCSHDDGVMHIIIMRMRPETTRLDMLNLFLGMGSGSHVKLDFIEIYACTHVRVEPTDVDGHMAVDGEAIPYTDTEITMCPGAAKTYTIRH